MTTRASTRIAGAAWLPPLLLAAIAVAGLETVKWQPYLARAWQAAASASIGLSILGDTAAPPSAGWQAGIDYAVAYGRAVWKALVLGLLLGAGVQVLLSPAAIGRVLNQRGGRLRAAAAALPSMMCTCCATPIAVGLIRNRADRRAVLVYWLANPVLNPATLVFIALLLGWHWMMLRLLLGAGLVFGLSHLADAVLPVGSRLPMPTAGDRPRGSLPLAYAETLLRLSVQLVPEYLLLVLALGAARAWLFPVMSPSVGHAAWLPPILAGIGTLFVIPTAGEVPVVQTLQRFGLGGPGIAALLLTLPTLSLPSLVMLGRVLPARALAVLAAGTFGFGLLAAVLAATLRF